MIASFAAHDERANWIARSFSLSPIEQNQRSRPQMPTLPEPHPVFALGRTHTSLLLLEAQRTACKHALLAGWLGWPPIGKAIRLGHRSIGGYQLGIVSARLDESQPQTRSRPQVASAGTGELDLSSL